ncbi:hypothetical protein LUZ62_055379 [Rhynchospora pubera]|uniref:Transmembrane protein 234 n=1 Tax=Rhynchospora pubera TaxID=906938 RepID=A0AAV8DY02_9POAL|nr:hypothetical protein LUZ62_055379 [Rhynchospora pubera]
MAGDDVVKMIGVGLIWGATNAFMRRGAAISSSASSRRGWLGPMLTWQYAVPFLINLSASALFFYLLGGAPISLAVPVTNATTFAATAVTALLLGEEMRVGPTFVGTAVIILGVWICVA